MSELTDLQRQFSKMLADLIVWCYAQNYTVRLSDVYRSTDKLYVPQGHEDVFDVNDPQYSYQELLFYNKKTKLIYSKHNDRLAADLLIEQNGVLLSGDGYRSIGEQWENMGGRWGGRFGVNKTDYDTKIGWDSNHFEL
jgi:hypothetical protein